MHPMVRSSLPLCWGACSRCALASLAITTLAVGPVCFSWPAGSPPRGLPADCRLRREHAGAERLILGRIPVSTATGALELGLGICLALWGSGLLQARAGLRVQGAGRRMSRPVATAVLAASAAGAAAPETAEDGFDASLQPGTCAPYGEPGVSYWDPAGLATGVDSATFRDYRKAELKHGRVSMLAVVGLILQHEWRFDLAYPYEAEAYDFSSVPSGIGAMAAGAPSSPFIGLFVLAAGLVELRASDDGREPGDFGDPFSLGAAWVTGYGSYAVPDDEERMLKDAELNHCRLAMVGVIGALVAEYATGLDAIDQWARSGAAVRRTLALLSSQGPVPPLPDF